MKIQTVLAASLFLSLAACDDDPGKGKTKATVAEAVSVASAPANAPAVTATKFVFSGADSKVEYVGAKVTLKHDGAFKTFQGSIDLPEPDASKGTVTVEVDIDSIISDNPKLTGHLKSPDFFDAAKFPKAKFVSTSISVGGEKGASHTVTGNLDLHGVTKSISFPANIKVGSESVDVDAEFVINRKDFGIVYPGMPDDLIKDEVLLKLQIRAKKAG